MDPVAETGVATAPGPGTVIGNMEIVVRGRNVVVPDHYRQHVADKLAKLERYDHKIHRADVELQHEKNPRQNGSCQHVEITCRTRGPVVRSEACAEDFYTALDIAADRLERRLRQAADRRRVHHGRRTPPSLAEVTAALPLEPVDQTAADAGGAGVDGFEASEHEPGRIVRVKDHAAEPMSVDQALFQMELVGHDFFLFNDVDSGRPSVVYRRHAFDYGLIRLSQ
jgi:ribosomal subunit interface protein